jgi:NADPH-dependent 2,4-dienoyl-CoA reductase/sulfur reductase-like enzyme
MRESPSCPSRAPRTSTGPLSQSRSGPGLVVVGAGVAGLRVVEGVRREGYEGPVTLVGAEPHLPYDRPPLSKQVLTDENAPEVPVYRPASFLAELDVEVRTGVRAESLDVDRRIVTVRSAGVREEIPFTALVVATGARPRTLPCVGPETGVHVVRRFEDSLALRAELYRRPRVAVVGAGFIGAEVASSARTLGLDVTVVEAAPSPLGRAVGPHVGRLLGGLHAQNGARLLCGRGVTRLIGGERVEGLVLDDGTVIDADLVVVGVGVIADVEWLRDSGLGLNDGLECDEYLRARGDVVFGAGDVASWPNALMAGARVRSQQWTTSADQGKHVAKVLVHGPEKVGPFGHDLYFWSDQYGTRIQGAGRMSGDASSVEHDPAVTKLVATWSDGERTHGAVTVNSPKEFRRLRVSFTETVDRPRPEAKAAAVAVPTGGIA